jgi:acyl-CoA synthetase (AMP-forming)/AMP-acid ligase II
MDSSANPSVLTDELSAVLRAWQTRLLLAELLALPSSLPALVHQQARIHGDKVLIHLFEDQEQITYSQFDELSNALAVGLVSAGLRVGERVAVMLPNCIQYHLTWLALAKIGAVIVPVNPSYTPRELSYVLGDSQAAGWVFHHDAANQVDAVADKLPDLRNALRIEVQGGLQGDSGWHRLLKNGSTNAPSLNRMAAAPQLDSLLNIQYTSGTTGFPKGCMLTHGYWLTLAQGAMSAHVQPYTQFFTAQPFFYMDPFWQLLQTVWSGGTLVAAKKLSASKFFGWLAEHRIEWAQLPELALKSKDSVYREDLALRQVFTFGWSMAARTEFVESFNVVANEAFGMTEIGLGLAMPPAWPADDRSTSVGQAALRRRASLMVVDGNTARPAVTGETGELWIKGDHLFKGYWNKPDVNSEVLQDGWFKTGDAFVQDEAGFYRIVGRFKDMIRRSNENIAAREVEAVVRMLAPVLDCAAVAVPDTQRGEEVKVWVQLKPDYTQHDLEPHTVIDHCQKNLAPFKVPRYIAFIADMPRTASNKIAKTQLPKTGATDSFDRQSDSN